MKRLAALVVLLSLPCQAAIGQEIRDSLGIQIVENGGSSWTPEAAWTVADVPELSIGSVEDSPPQYLFSRIVGVLLLSDDRVAVADGGSSQVRFFGPDGVFQGLVGREGEGPGEFRWLGWIGECRADFLDAYDLRLGRITSIRLSDLTVGETRLIRSASFNRPPSIVQCVDGVLVGVVHGLGIPPATPGPVRWPVRIERYDPDGAVRLIAEIPGDDRYFDGGDLGPRALGRRAVIAAAGDLIVTGTQDGPEVSIRTVTGELSRIIRWPDSSLAVTPADREAFVQGLIRSARSEAAVTRIRSRLRDYPFPSHHPAYGNVLFDDDGNLWVEASRRPSRPGNDWRVLSPSGEFLGVVSFPRGFRPMSFKRERVAGVWRDDLSVEFVWVLGIRKPGRS